jgi:hypothetical protein
MPSEPTMANDDVLRCPLCHGHSHLNRSESIDLLSDRNLPEKIEKYLTELRDDETAAVGANRSEPRDFEKDVHTWNPQLPIWRRCPKE